MFTKTQAVAINYLLCQYSKVKCGKIAYPNAFTITAAVKITLLHYKKLPVHAPLRTKRFLKLRFCNN